MKEDLEKIIWHYGKESQVQMAIEEMSELMKELCKDFRGKGAKDHISEEIADVEVMIQQLKIIYGITDKTIEALMKSKIERTIRRINNE